ncbi:MAG: excalibur calcium-binding domain-containing protein [Pseudonocardiaceae bacterium]
MPPQDNVPHRRRKAARLGKALVLVLVALLSLLVLPLGGLIVIGLGVYLGVQAHRARALPAAEAGEPSSPVPGNQPGAPVRRIFGLKPSYGLSAACTVTGILVFIGGVAVFSTSAAPQDQSAPASSAPAAPAAAPDTASQPAASPEPVLAEPPVDSAPIIPAPASRQTQATKPAQPIKTPDKPVRAQPVAPQPVESQPIERQPVAPQPVTESGGGAPYYRNCTEARAAGAAPLHRGEPGYRDELDRDQDGTACDKR